MEKDDNKFKITCQCCNGFVAFKGNSGELLHINFFHAILSTFLLYPEELFQFLNFQWPFRKKMQCVYQKLLKEGNGDNKFLRCPYLQDNNLGVMCSSIQLDKVDLECAETVRAKPTGNDSGSIVYSKTINFSGIWLDNSGYLITQWKKLVK